MSKLFNVIKIIKYVDHFQKPSSIFETKMVTAFYNYEIIYIAN